MLHSLLYRSVATHSFSDLSLRALTVRAAQRNKEVGITGVLLHGSHEHARDVSGAFLQWIEGPQDKVEDLFKSISGDSRHTSIEVIARGPLADIAGTRQRMFPDWDMKSATMGDLPATLAGFLSHARGEKKQGLSRALAA